MEKFIVKLLLSAFTVLLVSWITPGMTIRGGFPVAILVALTLSIMDYFVISTTHWKEKAAFGELTGFLFPAALLFFAGKVVPGFYVSLFGALFGAFILGIVEMKLPSGRIF